ncbi:hypothetical protein [Paraburkholderia sp. DGU8]|uniref:hypothetical protein n=1 Tax=Paraburkholderia sp. DGU8 TaxID=3161997 RepID=UPI00346770AC
MMSINEKELRAIHLQACAAVLKSDEKLTPEADEFWPVYLLAALSAAGATRAGMRAAALEEAANVCTARAELFARTGSRPLQRAALNCAEAIRTLREVRS